MCGIAGIIYRDESLVGHLGADLAALIQPLESRGPDSSGIALYTRPIAAGQVKLVLRGEAGVDWGAVQDWIEQAVPVLDTHVTADDRRFILDLTQDLPFQVNEFRRALRTAFPSLHVMSLGQGLEIYKEVGAVDNLIQKYGLTTFQGTHGIAHTRMATESVVDIDHCHPFTTNFDLAIVHNGQISNYYRLRFQLERAGMVFETHNDSETIVNYIHYQLLQGKSLEESLEALLHDIDGTYTFLVATPDKVALVRDKFAAKPAVIYEAADKVAIASEYRSLLQLSNFDPNALIREPDAGEINIWPVTTPAQTAAVLSVIGS
ncbi:amidophosphoribosyltransferase [Pseudanabaena sp. FACHB-2040]|uniref:amidophosphoribosyltransferase n=1 Tax=Pseudanabaena sp. FACHB-2040 TaxID=2692859 RepID=UPI00168722C3|nr:amidophosphoribosyltransferase [Pseudanabaena sp. FACHB-2040]MBD2260382.1 amidophosphoribosyltransferase [Pseudanabaena sp. FACHB-2040]